MTQYRPWSLTWLAWISLQALDPVLGAVIFLIRRPRELDKMWYQKRGAQPQTAWGGLDSLGMAETSFSSLLTDPDPVVFLISFPCMPRRSSGPCSWCRCPCFTLKMRSRLWAQCLYGVILVQYTTTFCSYLSHLTDTNIYGKQLRSPPWISQSRILGRCRYRVASPHQ